MRYRISTVFAKTDLTDGAGTKTLDMNMVDMVSRICLVFKAKNGVVDVMDHPAANVTKIELVDGSDVLFSVSGKEAQGVNFYNRGKKPYSWINGHDAEWNSAEFGIDFGRYLYDPVLALDPKRFSNLQLRVTYDENICNTSAGDNYFEVRAYLFDEFVPSPIGFFVTKNIYSYALTANAYEYIDLPVDHVLRQIFVKTLEAGYDYDTHIAEIRLNEDNEKRIPIDLSSGEIQRDVYEKYGDIEENAYMDGETATHFIYSMITSRGVGYGSGYGDHEVVAVWTLDGGKFGFNMEVGTLRAKIVMKGNLPHGILPVLFHKDDEIDDWYDVTRLGNLRLRVKGGSSIGGNATAEILIQQLRKY